MRNHGEEVGALARLNTTLHLQSLYHLPSGGLYDWFSTGFASEPKFYNAHEDPKQNNKYT